MGPSEKLKCSQNTEESTDKKRIFDLLIVDSTQEYATVNKCTTLHEDTSVRSLCEHVSQLFGYKIDTFELVIPNSTKEVVLNSLVTGSLKDVGIKLEQKMKLIIRELEDGSTPLPIDAFENDEDDYIDDLKLGASASPTSSGDAPINYYSPESTSCVSPPPSNYIGLVNQAMTCYLNSLLQTLFMTPEFRNALYKWKFDGDVDEGDKSIPYQLQRLFLRLQMSERPAVETTELTRSFGWDSSETWQQHDIQELCRVMFDTLEQTFKGTSQKNLISLYEGKMFDYVKCLECSTEKAREDTYLDIPLSIRSFDCTEAYGSVEESLRAFVQPEILDGNNQYFCEKCDKKVDAHKGLKFKTFPYLLTLQLKRFTFDYQSFHRIKLNDRVTFPEKLDLSNFFESPDDPLTFVQAQPAEETCIKCDDCSTADSGAAIDDDSAHGTDNSVHSRDPLFSNDQEDDEGISLSNSTHPDSDVSKEKSKYLYELFSVMIHSGSASGGHYYAYIKSFKTDEWYCFNDNNVYKITIDDVRRMFGGAEIGSHSFNQSVNAYMLMYRQFSPERNAKFIEAEDFPDHIRELWALVKKNDGAEKERRELERERKEMERNMWKSNVFYQCPQSEKLESKEIRITRDTSLIDAMETAREMFDVEVPLERCRLVKYNPTLETIEMSFDGQEMECIDILMPYVSLGGKALLLQTLKEGAEWSVYRPNFFPMYVYVVNVDKESFDEAVPITADLNDTVLQFKETLAKKFYLDISRMMVLIRNDNDRSLFLTDGNETLRSLQIQEFSKALICAVPNAADNLRVRNVLTKLCTCLRVKVLIPEEQRDFLVLPGLPRTNESSASMKDSDSLGYSSDLTQSDNDDDDPIDSNHGSSIQSDQSASEDSSLTDSVKTLIGDPYDDARNESPVDNPSLCSDLITLKSNEERREDGEPERIFKVFPDKDASGGVALLLFISEGLSIGEIKGFLEPYVGIKKSSIKLCEELADGVEIHLVDSRVINYLAWKPNNWKLKRIPQPGEHLGKLYMYAANSEEHPKALMDFRIMVGAKLGDVRLRIVKELKSKHDIQVPAQRCRIRKKKWTLPGEIYLNNYKFGNKIPLFNSWELFVEILPDNDVKVFPCQVALYFRRWSPSIPKLGDLKEIVLDRSCSPADLWDKVSQESGLPAGVIELAVMKSSVFTTYEFYDNEKKFEWKGFGEWDPNPELPEEKEVSSPESCQNNNSPSDTSMAASAKPNNSDTIVFYSRYKKHKTPASKPIGKFEGNLLTWEDGQVLVFRDKNEEMKVLSKSELMELTTSQMKITSPQTYTPVYSPKREKALKIYLSNSNKTEVK